VSPGRGRTARILTPGGLRSRVADVASRAPLIAHQRHRARHRRWLRKLVRLAGLVAAVGLGLAMGTVLVSVGGAWLRATPWLQVAEVEVTGAQTVSAAAVRGAAAVAPGANLLGLDVEAIVDRVEALPGVRSARVVRHLPRHVTVVIEEREPYALVNPAGGERLVWIDQEGRLAAPDRRAGPPSLPILSGVRRVVQATDQPTGDDLRTGLLLLRAVQRTGGRVPARVSEIDVASAQGPILYLEDGAEVRVGTEDWDERLARLDGVLAELDSRGERILAVDLRFRDLVVLTPRNPAPTEARRGASARRRPGGAAGGPAGTPTESR
jgi:cell division septal protein FtsQ